MTTTTSLLEQQIAALLRQLEETKEAERLEAERKEAEAAAEKARVEEEERRLQAEAKRMRHIAEQERREREQEEEVRRRRPCEESSLTPLAAMETELPTSKGKGPELVLELEGGQESRRCDSCEKRNVECIRIKVHGNQP